MRRWERWRGVEKGEWERRREEPSDSDSLGRVAGKRMTQRATKMAARAASEWVVLETERRVERRTKGGSRDKFT